MNEDTPAIPAILAAIASLHEDMKAGFARVDARFNAVDARLDRVETAILDVGNQLLTGYEMTRIRERMER